MNHAPLHQKYQAEIERLDDEYRDLARMWTQVPRFALFALAALPVGYIWGWGAAVVALLVSAALVGTRAYLVAVRQTENRWNRDKLVDDLSEQAVDERRESVPRLRSGDVAVATGC